MPKKSHNFPHLIKEFETQRDSATKQLIFILSGVGIGRLIYLFAMGRINDSPGTLGSFWVAVVDGIAGLYFRPSSSWRMVVELFFPLLSRWRWWPMYVQRCQFVELLEQDDGCCSNSNVWCHVAERVVDLQGLRRSSVLVRSLGDLRPEEMWGSNCNIIIFQGALC